MIQFRSNLQGKNCINFGLISQSNRASKPVQTIKYAPFSMQDCHNLDQSIFIFGVNCYFPKVYVDKIQKKRERREKGF